MKSIFASKTFWLGVATFLIGGLEAIKSFLTPEQVGIVIMVIGILGIIVRYLTTEPVQV